MMHYLFFILSFLIVGQNKIDQKYDAKTYEKYFPFNMDDACYSPTPEYIFILPTAELDSNLQKENIDYYYSRFINPQLGIPYNKCKIITDVEALNEDLSNTNIFALGTINGNLWIKNVYNNIIDLPVKIYSDSIVTDTVYTGTDMNVLTLWYNPFNPKFNLFLYISQDAENAKGFRINMKDHLIIAMKNSFVLNISYYHYRDGIWSISPVSDTLLDYRKSNLIECGNFKNAAWYNEYPSPDQLWDCCLQEKNILDTLKIIEDPSVSTVCNYEWLKEVAAKNKIVTIGEEHHFVNNKYLLQQILFSLNSNDNFNNLFIEMPLSCTGIFNTYINIGDDSSAEIFRQTYLKDIIGCDYETLNVLRKWNSKNREKKITIHCTDIEHDLSRAVRLLQSYFKLIDPEIKLNINDPLFSDIGEKILTKATKLKINGTYSFMNPEFMKMVFYSTISSYRIKMIEDRDEYLNQRNKAIIFNITNTGVFGEIVNNEKCVFYGGNEHFRTLNKGDNPFIKSSEGYYLNYENESTKGKVYSISLHTIGFIVGDSIPKVDKRINYNMESQFLEFWKKGIVELNKPYIICDLSDIEKLVMLRSYDFKGYAFRLNVSNPLDLLEYCTSHKRVGIAYQIKEKIADYNTVIYIPYSEIGN